MSKVFKARDKAYTLMAKVRLLAESIGVKVTEHDFTILDKMDELYDAEREQEILKESGDIV